MQTVLRGSRTCSTGFGVDAWHLSFFAGCFSFAPLSSKILSAHGFGRVLSAGMTLLVLVKDVAFILDLGKFELPQLWPESGLFSLSNGSKSTARGDYVWWLGALESEVTSSVTLGGSLSQTQFLHYGEE